MSRIALRHRAQWFTSLTVSIVATAVGSATNFAHGAEIFAYAHASDIAAMIFDDSSSENTTGALISADVSAGGSSASYSVNPQLGFAYASGSSKPISFEDWKTSHPESQADGYVRLIDRITINGPISQHGDSFDLRVMVTGDVTPNAAFEQEYYEFFGARTVTSVFNMHTVFTNSTTSFPRDRSITGIPGADHLFVLDESFSQTILPDASPEDRVFGIDILVSAAGFRGGSFILAGFEGASGSASSADAPTNRLAAGNGAGLLDTSFLEIVVELPPGLTFTAEGGHFMRLVTIPEPTALPLFAIGLAGILNFAERRHQR